LADDMLAELPDLEREGLLACLEFASRSLRLRSQHLGDFVDLALFD